MTNGKNTVRLSELVLNKLNTANATHGFIFGWHKEKAYTCADCARTSEYLLPGVECIGEFLKLENLPESDEQLIDIAKKHIENSFEQQDSESSSFHLSGQDELLLFVHQTPGQENPTIRAIHYFAFVSSFEILAVSDVVADLENILLFRAKGKIPLLFEGSVNEELQEENLKLAVGKLKSLFMEGLPVLFYEGNNTILQHFQDVSPFSTCGDFMKQLTSDSGVEKKQKKGKKLGLNEKVPVDFKILIQGTGKTAVMNNVDHSLVIHCQRREFLCVSLHLPIDVVVAVEDNFEFSSLYELFRDSIVQQLDEFEQCLQRNCEETKFSDVEVYHFYPYGWKLPVTLVYPTELSDDKLAETRKKLMENLFLPADKPLFRRSNRCNFSGDLTPSGYIINPHLGLPTSGVEGGTVAVVSGKYAYHHYMQDHMNDDGWGCAYRSLQTIVSWFQLQGYTNRNVPTHTEIQQALVDIGDKNASFVGSRKWIGSQEVSFCLDHFINVISKILVVSSGADMDNYGQQLLHHFRSNGTPVMIGGGVLAHTILGVDYNQKSGALKFLVLDPHYTGSEDIGIIQSKGWCGWKNTSFWNKTAFYNLCMPQRPALI